MLIFLTILSILFLLILIGMFMLLVRIGKRPQDFESKFEQLEKNQERIERIVREEVARNRGETNLQAHQNREEMVGALKSFGDSVEKRLGESFKIMSERLEAVYKGLGEMQRLASSVGDLKKILTNVKTRGIWGEVQLGVLLDQMLTPQQYEKNVVTKKGSKERVEFAIKLPGQNKDERTPLWLPIDAKFPQEDYQRLLEAQEKASPELAERAARQLEARIKNEAKDIRDKYIDPPNTTDYGIMFLPTEGLYAEVLRRPGLSETLQRDYRIIVTGPTTLAAVLSSLQIGFRTLAIEKRSSQIWKLLVGIKTEFTKFGDILDRVMKKLQEAVRTVEEAYSKTRNIQRKLRKVEELPFENKPHLIEDTSTFEAEDKE